MDDAVAQNQKTWDNVCDLFVDASALPNWGPFSVGCDLDLIGPIKGKRLLEVACGSGRSIKYLTQRGADKVYGLDLSANQLAEARQHNQSEIDEGSVDLIHAPMEEPLNIEEVDVIFSVYGLGWTLDPQKTFANLYQVLKPGGFFVWSWDHSFFSNVRYDTAAEHFFVHSSYHDEQPRKIEDWRKPGQTVYIAYRKTSTWFRLMREAGFDVVAYEEPVPQNTQRAYTDPTRYYSLPKAQRVPSSFIFKAQKPL